ncbi:SRPBCC family protein [Emcibacter sp. SYSU 3D8]|uniref:SRPBCC family protein n=1 Tax=Emcibacter sp. SYSU 3D8 TaxID=3133969 RepID=UPI0031FE953E
MGYAIGTMAMDVPAAKAWDSIADFGGLLTWMPPLEGATLSTKGSGVGMVRTLSLPGLGAGDERLDANDNANMIQVLSITTGGPFGATRYQARLSVRAEGENACTCFWEGFFDAPAGVDDDEIRQQLEGAYAFMLGGLKSHLGG